MTENIGQIFHDIGRGLFASEILGELRAKDPKRFALLNDLSHALVDFISLPEMTSLVAEEGPEDLAQWIHLFDRQVAALETDSGLEPGELKEFLRLKGQLFDQGYNAAADPSQL